jgi:hypothetical protein
MTPLRLLLSCASKLMPLSPNTGSIGLGIALVFSCYSPKTKDLNIYTVQPLYFLRDFVANSSYTTQSGQNYTTLQNYSSPSPSPSPNAPFQNYPELQYNSSVNFSSLGLPELYYFGVSGKLFLPLGPHAAIYTS